MLEIEYDRMIVEEAPSCYAVVSLSAMNGVSATDGVLIVKSVCLLDD